MPRIPIHPGEILADELEELGMTGSDLAENIHVPPSRISQILTGRISVTADMADLADGSARVPEYGSIFSSFMILTKPVRKSARIWKISFPAKQRDERYL